MEKRGQYAKGAERREEILTTAFEVLSRDGYRGASLNQIGRAIGLDSAHILYYFRSREDLLQEVLGRWDAVNQMRETDGDFFSVWLRAVRHNAGNAGILQLYTVYAAEASDPAHPSHGFFQGRFDRLRAGLIGEITRLQARGLIAAAVDAEWIASILVPLSDGLQIRWLVDRSTDMAGILQSAIETLLGVELAGLRAATGG